MQGKIAEALRTSGRYGGIVFFSSAGRENFHVRSFCSKAPLQRVLAIESIIITRFIAVGSRRIGSF